MTHGKRRTLFFAGTDTDVGKTYVAATVARTLVAAGRRVGVYKPVASGCRVEDDFRVADDALALWNAAGHPQTLDEVCPQRFLAPLAPPVAAAAEGSVVDTDRLVDDAGAWDSDYDPLIVEGAGGLMSPIAEGMLNIDLVAKFEPCRLVIVAADRLGVIHQTIATCEAAKHRGVTPHGIVLSQPAQESDESTNSNLEQLRRYCDVPVIGHVAFGQTRVDESMIQKLLN